MKRNSTICKIILTFMILLLGFYNTKAQSPLLHKDTVVINGITFKVIKSPNNDITFSMYDIYGAKKVRELISKNDNNAIGFPEDLVKVNNIPKLIEIKRSIFPNLNTRILVTLNINVKNSTLICIDYLLPNEPSITVNQLKDFDKKIREYISFELESNSYTKRQKFTNYVSTAVILK